MTIHRLCCNLTAVGLLTVAGVTGPIAQAQTYNVVYNFDETPHGCCSYYPGILAQGRNGNIYGTTLAGGHFGYGTVFVITPNGALSTLHDFDITDGAGPQGGLALGLDGDFYGTTYQGGAGSAGTVFKITPGGMLKVLYSFLNNGDGAFPRTPPVPAPDGNLYGITANHAASTLYRITPAGVLTVLATLPAESDAPLTLASGRQTLWNDALGWNLQPGHRFFNHHQRCVYHVLQLR